tara:strand:- start:158 stop:415 length:258 start_codon:yes stop_codon:yes gene_type:complete
MTYKIENNIPIPANDGRGRGKSKLRLTIEKMEIGNSIVIPIKKLRGVHQIAYALGIKVITRKINSDETRVWRIAHDGMLEVKIDG